MLLREDISQQPQEYLICYLTNSMSRNSLGAKSSSPASIQTVVFLLGLTIEKC